MNDLISESRQYLDTCYVAVTNRGLEIRSVAGDEYFTELYRSELPRGPIGDEMWERLTTGLRLRSS